MSNIFSQYLHEVSCRNYNALQYASESLKSNIEFMSQMISENCYSVEYASESIKAQLPCTCC